METKVMRFVPHGLNSPEVKQRIAQGPQIAQARVARISARLEPHWNGFVKRINDVIASHKSIGYKILTYWQIVDEIMSYTQDDVACKAGCSHCCYAAVLLPHAEAEVIGRRIRREPAKAKKRKNAHDVRWGYDNPCVFLGDDERCTIYENRPMVCRVHYSLDVDALMCEMTPPESKPVPFYNDMIYQQTLLMLIAQHTRSIPSCGEIREFWPNGNH
jgi:Fe-S-cluster containining protein